MRSALLLLLSLLLLPSSARAQVELVRSGPRASFTLFTGARASFTLGESLVYDTVGRPVLLPRQERGGAPILGAEARVRVAGPVALVAAAIVGRTGRSEYFVSDTAFGDPPDAVRVYPGNTLLGRAGLSVRFQHRQEVGEDRPRATTDVSFGGAVVRELRTTHPALNFGFQGAIPVGQRLEFVLGLEDYLVFWRQGALQRESRDVLGKAYQTRFGEIEPLYDTSNLLTLRAGVSLRAF